MDDRSGRRRGERNLEHRSRAAGAAARGGAVQEAVDDDQAGLGVLAGRRWVEAVDDRECRVRAADVDTEHRARVKRASALHRPVEAAVGRLHQRRHRREGRVGAKRQRLIVGPVGSILNTVPQLEVTLFCELQYCCVVP